MRTALNNLFIHKQWQVIKNVLKEGKNMKKFCLDTTIRLKINYCIISNRSLSVHTCTGTAIKIEARRATVSQFWVSHEYA